MRRLNIFIIFILAPFVGLFIGLNQFDVHSQNLVIETTTLNQSISDMKEEVGQLKGAVDQFGLIATIQETTFEKQNERLSNLTEQSGEFTELSDDIYEQKILDVLGPAVAYHKSENNEIKIFSLNELGYRGYIAKIKLYDPESFKVVLGEDELGKTETTSDVAERTEAIFAINGGGFYYEE